MAKKSVKKTEEEIKEVKQEVVEEKATKKSKKKDTKPKEEGKVEVKEELKEEPKVEVKEEPKVEVKEEPMKPIKVKKERRVGVVIVVILLFILLLSVLGLGFVYFISPYEIMLNGESDVNVTLNGDYEDQGAVVKRFIFVANKTIEVEGEVDTSKQGDYKIVYKSDSLTVKRTVHVKDKNAPQVVMDKDDSTLELNVNGKKDIYKNISFIDNTDGELEDIEVEDDIDMSKPGEYEIKYKACDKSKNCTEVTRKVVVKDMEAPIITINRTDLTIPVGNTYTEYGATAVDNYDKKLGDIKIESNVDTSKVGTYEVKYSICDSSDNCVSKIRTVKVVEKETKEDNTKTNTTSIISGSFKSHPSIDGTLPSTLTLNGSNKTASIVINKCEGTDTISGTYTVSGSTITLRLNRAIDPGQPSVLKFTIINNNTLRLDTDITSCAPWKNEKFTRV